MVIQGGVLPMDGLSTALQGAASAAPQPHAAHASILLLGAGGALGSVLLAQALADARLGPVQALVHRALGSTVRGLVPVLAPQPQQLNTNAECAVIVFERTRHSNGRDDVFVMPPASELVPWGQALRRCGVRRLLVVVPHAPAMLPSSLKAGFASHDEAALAQLGFEQLLVLRSAQYASDAGAGAGRLQGFANWWLSQLAWMVPAAQQPVRAPRLAALVLELAHQLRHAPMGTRVLAPELLQQAAQSHDAAGLLGHWLRGPSA
jgi:hypothetical protein